MIIGIPSITLLTSLSFLRPVLLAHFTIYLLIPFICCCNYSDTKKIPVTREITGVTSWGSPAQLLNSLLSDPKVGPVQLAAAFKSDRRFDDWKRHYPEQMMECAANFPLDSGRELTVDVFTHWVKKSYDESASFIEEKVVGSSLRDSAIEGMVNGLKSDQLSVAVSWAHELSDQGKRHQLLESLATH